MAIANGLELNWEEKIDTAIFWLTISWILPYPPCRRKQ